MRKLTYTALIIALLGTACSEQPSSADSAENLAKKMQEIHKDGRPPVNDNLVNAVSPEDLKAQLTVYFELKNNLFDSDAASASKSAAELGAKVNAENAFLTAWKEDIAKIAASDDLEQQRLVFKNVTASMMGLVNANLPEGEAYYWQYCPMAFDDQGAFWLNEKAEIINPYFGEQMPHCGVVKAEIK